MKDDLNIFGNRRRPQIFQMQDDLKIFLNFFIHGRHPQFFQMEMEKIMQPKQLTVKTMVVAPLQVT